MGTDGRGTKAKPDVTLKLQEGVTNMKQQRIAQERAAHMVALSLPWMCGMAK